MAILISSHNLAELESFITDVCFIKNGEVIKRASIKEVKANGVKPSYIITLDKVDKLDKVLNIDYKVQDESIIIQVEREELPDIVKLLVEKNYKIVRKLVNGGYSIYQVTEFKASLEEAFLSKTGGNKID